MRIKFRFVYYQLYYPTYYSIIIGCPRREVALYGIINKIWDEI